MRTHRQHRLDLACAQELVDCGRTYVLPDAALCQGVALRVMPRPTTAEIEESIRYMDTERRILGVDGETGPKWKITDVGRAWHMENS